MHVIGEETSERLDVIPAQFRVIVTHRPKYACRACEKIVETPAPEHLIKSGIPTEAMVAHVLVAKYGWHLPLYRQAQMFLAQGIKLDRSTLAFWVGYAAAELLPLHERMRMNLLGSAKLAVDETTVPVLDPGRGRTKTGYFWTMARDDRPWGGTDPPCVVYSYAPGRGSVHAATLLADYHGIVQCDGYSAYKKLNQNRIVLAFCGRIYAGDSTISPRKATRRSQAKRSSALPSSTESKRRSAAEAPANAARRARRRASPRSWPCATGLKRSSPKSLPNRPWPRRSATA